MSKKKASNLLNFGTLFSFQLSGGNDEMVTPVPIPNTAVKHLSADNTWLETARESKSLPDLYQVFVLIARRLVLF